MRKILALAAVLSAIAMTAPAASAAGSGKFCLNGPGTTKSCTYQSMAACDKAKKGQQTCAEEGTTGAGTSQSAPIGNSGSPMNSSSGGTMKK